MNISKFFNHDFQETDDDSVNFYLFDKNNNMIYAEHFNGWWAKYKHDSESRTISKVCSDGYWWEREYDSDGNEINYKSSDDKYEDIENKIHDFDTICQKDIKCYKAGSIRDMFLDFCKAV